MCLSVMDICRCCICRDCVSVLVYDGYMLMLHVYIVDTAVYQTETRLLHSDCGRRDGISLLDRLLKCLYCDRVKEVF